MIFDLKYYIWNNLYYVCLLIYIVFVCKVIDMNNILFFCYGNDIIYDWKNFIW